MRFGNEILEGPGGFEVCEDVAATGFVKVHVGFAECEEVGGKGLGGLACGC
jgi:hypothetical protein